MAPFTTILLVAPTRQVADMLSPALAAAGHQTIVTRDFDEAKALLSGRPKLLITEIKLGAYNGLHLAIRAEAIGTPTVVIGDSDPVLERDARRIHAAYLTLPLDRDRAVSVATELLERAVKERRSSRRRVKDVDALANDWQAQLVDVSYEGMRLEAGANPGLPKYFEVRVPRFNFSCQVERIWTSPGVIDATHLCCGAALFPSNLETALAWRALVDALPTELLAT